MRHLALAAVTAGSLAGVLLAGKTASGAPPKRLTPDTVAGTAAGERVTLREIDRYGFGTLTRLWRSIDAVKRAALEQRIDDLLLGQAGPPEAPIEPALGDVQALLATLPSDGGREDAEPYARDLAQRLAFRRARAEQLAALRERAAIRRLLPDRIAPGEPAYPAVVAEVAPAPGAAVLRVRNEELERAERLELYQLRARVVAEAERVFRERADARLVAREAARRGVTPQALEWSLAAKAQPVTDEDITAYYAEHREELGAFRPARIRGYLEFRARAAARETVLGGLREADPPRFALVAPEPPRFPEEVEAGPPGAPVALTVFSNFRCRLCAEVDGVVEALSRDGPPVRVTRRHLFPEESLAAYLDAVAATCAERAGAGEPFRAALFGALERGARPRAHEVGRAVVSDPVAFDACRRDPETRARVLADLDAAARIGFDEAPGFLVGDLPVAGFQGQERLAELLSDTAPPATGRSTPGSGTQ